MTEEVLVIPTSLLRKCGKLVEFAPMSDNYLPVFASQNQEFRPRDEVEDNPELKQLIPYIIVEHRGRILNYYRGKGRGEKRLRGLRSIGIGGHINPCDLTEALLGRIANRDAFLDDKYVRGMLRELNEELRFKRRPEVWDLRLLGLINEDKTPVGKVHLGVVHVLHLAGEECEAGEEDIVDLDWHTRDVLLSAVEAIPESFELWSQICLKHINPVRATRKKLMQRPSRSDSRIRKPR